MGLLSTEIREFVSKVKLGYVATVCPDGTPNLSPKGTIMAWDEDHLAFADIYSPGTSSNLQHNPSIEINVVDVFTRKGYRFKGVAEVLQRGDVYDAILCHYQNAGSQYAINNIVFIQVDRVLPIASPAYDRLSEEEITNRWIEYWNAMYPQKKETK